MEKLLSILRSLIAVATVLLLASLAWHCMDIYLSGTETSSFDAVFTYDEVVHRLKSFAFPAMMYLSLILVTLLLQKKKSASEFHSSTKYSHKAACQKAAVTGGKRSILHWGLLIAGTMLVLWGTVNGGLYDVLVKSINICTECIGLG